MSTTWKFSPGLKLEILKRLARGRGTCSGDYRIMERETGKLCTACKAKYDSRREKDRVAAAAAGVAAAAGGEDEQGVVVESSNPQQ
ncbi:hypothetical protein QBC45DRAFT_338723 [Copromyces sp. CBS 386.78]|nr:hypothetical protein QBC45DRAFT_338723 [Copromyces sp. CBS 386.78]